MSRYLYYIANAIYIIMMSGLVAYFVFIYRFSFNYEINQNDQYHLIWILPVAALFFILIVLYKKQPLNSKQLGYLATVVPICLFVLFSRYYHLGNEHFYVTVCIFFTSGLFVFTRNVATIYIMMSLLSVLFAYQLYIGWVQYAEANLYADDISLSLKGSFQNSGVFACYLVSQLPVLHYALCGIVHLYLPKNRGRNLPVLFLCFIMLLSATLFLIYQSQSRSAWLALLVTTTAWLWAQYGTTMKSKLRTLPKIVLSGLALFTGTLLAGGSYYAFGLKKMSAMGRMMKLSVVRDHFADHFWWGTGWGRFSWYYPQWQAAYFKNHRNPPESYFLSAGESYILFNEPIQLLKEAGLWGTLLCVVCLILFFSTTAPVKHKRLFGSLKLVVVSLLAGSFTSYPFHVNYLLLLLAFCFFVVIGLGDTKLFRLPANNYLAGRLPASFRAYFSRYRYRPELPPLQACGLPSLRRFRFDGILLIAVALLMGYTAVKEWPSYNGFKKWEALQQGAPANNLQHPYKLLYPHLSNNGKFLTDYGTVLLQDSMQYSAATGVLELAREFHISRQGIEQLVEGYRRQNRLTEAIEQQKWLCHYLPNRFVPQSTLLQLYDAAGDRQNAKRIANNILSMPVKQPSADVENIKREAEKY